MKRSLFLFVLAVLASLPALILRYLLGAHPDHARRSLGTLAILLQVEAARAEGRTWLYLGYWIPDCRKMSYKAGFLPVEVRRPEREIREERWERLSSAKEREGFLQRLREASEGWSRP